jgi:hypothetical protein
MNDIEILENAIKCNKKQFEEIGTHILLQDDEMKAIENLIQRNKELEMQNKEFLLRLKADGLIERDKYWTNKIKKALYDGILEAKGWGCEDGAYLVQKEFENLIKEIN